MSSGAYKGSKLYENGIKGCGEAEAAEDKDSNEDEGWAVFLEYKIRSVQGGCPSIYYALIVLLLNTVLLDKTSMAFRGGIIMIQRYETS